MRATCHVDRATAHLLADHIRAGYPTYTPVDTAVTLRLAVLTVVGAPSASSAGWA